MKLTKLEDGRYLLEKLGYYPVVLDRTDVDEIAEHGRLTVMDVVRTSSGIEAVLEGGRLVHLCFSDEAEEFANKVLEASGFDYEAGRIRV